MKKHNAFKESTELPRPGNRHTSRERSDSVDRRTMQEATWPIDETLPRFDTAVTADLLTGATSGPGEQNLD
ncbi:MAG: hypothetical protein MK108_07610 [Mariniblastus sp.]|nr:hypothetical protein [Mariniblastus sp.]